MSELYDDRPDLASADPVTIAGANAVTGIDAVLASAGNAIAGTVTDTGGQPLAGIEVRLFQENPSTGARDLLGTFATTDAGGHYQVVGLTSGDYEVELVDPAGTYALQFYDGESDLASAAPVPATPGSVTSGIDAALSTGGAISGTVTNTLGQALRSVPVSFYRLDSGSGAWNPLGVAVRTDAAGGYLARGLPEGSYKAEFGSGAGTVFYRGEPDLDSADPVRVSIGATTSGIDATLVRPGTISGTVTTETGQPLAHASVLGLRFDRGGSLVEAVADAVGHYSITGVAPGDYEIYFSCNSLDGCSGNYVPEYWDDAPYPIEADPVSVLSGATTSGIDGALALAGTISGTVTGEAGEPLANVLVQAYHLESDGAWYPAGSDSTNASGHYAISHLAADDYKVGFATCVFCSGYGDYVPEYWDDRPDLDSADLVSVTSGGVTGGIDATLVSATQGSISGTVTGGSGQPLQGVRVDVYVADLGSGEWRSVANAATDAGGHYGVGGLRTGDYKVGFNACSGCDDNYLPRYSGGTEDLASADLVPVTSGSDTGGVDAALEDSGSISGTVTDGAGNPLAGVGVSAFRADPTDPFNPWGLAGAAATDASGHYRISGLATDPYRLELIDTSGALYVYDFYPHQQDLDSAQPVAVTAGVATTGIDESLPIGTGALTGTLTDGSGAPIHPALIQIYQRDASSGDWVLRVPAVGTNAAGGYLVPDLAAGEYKVRFAPPGNYGHPCRATDYTPVFYDGRADFASADVVQVTDGTTTSGIDASLATAGGCITGTVTGSFGQPLAGIDVNVWRRDAATGTWQYRPARRPWARARRRWPPATTTARGSGWISRPPGCSWTAATSPPAARWASPRSPARPRGSPPGATSSRCRSTTRRATPVRPPAASTSRRRGLPTRRPPSPPTTRPPGRRAPPSPSPSPARTAPAAPAARRPTSAWTAARTRWGRRWRSPPRATT